MAVEVTVPPLGESIREAQVGRWRKAPGDAVEVDEILVEIESDKITVEVPSPKRGVLASIAKQQGDTVRIGEVIGAVEEGAAKAKPAEASARPAEGAARHSDAAPSAPAGPPAHALSPSARQAAAETGVDPATVTGTGRGGRVTRTDILAAAEIQHRPAALAPQGNGNGPVAARTAPVPAAPAPETSRDGREEIIQMTPLRRRIAERLVEAQQTAAILTTFNEIDMSRVMDLRKRYQDRFEKKYGIKLGFMSFFVKGAVEALRSFPLLNSEIRGEAIVQKRYYDIGVAVGGGKGLVVPIVRDADKLSFAQVELTIGELAKKAKDNRLTLQELSGGTFTISNGGIYGSLLSTPILNPPQTGILGMHKIEERAVVIDGQIVARPMMYLALSYDHRLVDGREAVQFLVRIKECIEDPERLLLEV